MNRLLPAVELSNTMMVLLPALLGPATLIADLPSIPSGSCALQLYCVASPSSPPTPVTVPHYLLFHWHTQAAEAKGKAARIAKEFKAEQARIR